MAEEVANVAISVTQQKNLSSIYAKEIERARADEKELLDLKMLNTFLAMAVALNTKSMGNLKKSQKSEIEKLKHKVMIIIEVLSEPPISPATHRLVNAFYQDSIEKILTIGRHLRKTRKGSESAKRGLVGQNNNWLKHWDDIWLERRNFGKNWLVTDDVIQLELVAIRNEQSAIRKEQIENGEQPDDNMIIPHVKTINKERNRRFRLKK